ncbi:semaphorin-7A-like isoform X2 [Esox lucius]|uniref:semaphorin-7A-like isoform X2 n=1 Tax=Esox lucius TaxID=8010 RepID=UPI00147756CB|nr:semaphorin-7A-like isoform X2 [Esox lucius]
MYPHLLFGVFLAHFIFPMEASAHIHRPRVTLTEKDVKFPRVFLKESNTHMKFLQGHNTVYAAGNTQVYQTDFYSPHPQRQSFVFREECIHSTSTDCQYNITVLHKSKNANQLFLCGTNGEHTLCCNVESTDFKCTRSKDFRKIDQHINENEPTLLIDHSEAEEFYATQSGSEITAGIRRFGKNQVWSENSGTEQKYIGLVASGKREESLQDRLYAFYIEKNRDQSGKSDTWFPRVAQICMADRGGPKTVLQFKWTSKLSARLFCGDPERKLYFTDLVEVTTVVADRWQDTRVYTLFKNAWGTRAVCVYSMGDINHVFKTSNFQGITEPIPKPRPGECVADSTLLPTEVLMKVKTNLEMEEWVGNNNRPLWVTHHHYNHIIVDSVQGKGNVLLLSLENGRIHKVLESNGQAFIIAEIQPFNNKASILSMLLNSSTRKLYVGTSRELVQIDLVSCMQYKDRCEDCVQARDPYCGWDGHQCTTATNNTIQDVDNGNHTICKSNQATSSKVVSSNLVRVPQSSKYFLQCPARSNHAEYNWGHRCNNTGTICTFIESEHQYVLLIEKMETEQEGTYTCVSEEGGYTKTLAMFTVKLDSGATGLASYYTAWFWVVLTLVLVPL